VRAGTAAFVAALAALLRAAPIDGQGEGGGAAGFVVEEVAKGSPGEEVGIRSGDRIVAWSRAAAPPANPQAQEGVFESPFDLIELGLEQAPRGAVTLVAAGGRRWTLPPLPFGLTVRPWLDADLLALHEEGARLVRAKSLADGCGRWRAAAGRADRQGQPLVAVWFLTRVAKALADAGSWAEADAVHEQAAGDAERAGEAVAASHILARWAESLSQRREWDRTEACYRRALLLDEARRPDGLVVARDYNNLGTNAIGRGDLAAAEELLLRSLAIRERLAPGSLPHAASLNNLGLVARERGELAAADAYLRRTLAIESRWVPGSLDVALTLGNLGVIARAAGDLASAEERYRQAIAITEARAPGSLDLASSLKNLGVLERHRGDLDAAEALFRRALAIDEALAPDSPRVARDLINLGNLELDRGQLALAEEYQRRALALTEKATPGGLQSAGILSNLGLIAERRGDLATAEECYLRCRAVLEKLAPRRLELASVLSQLGTFARRRGDRAQAEQLYRRALGMREQLAPGSADEAESLHDLGLLRSEAGRLEEASGFLLRALDAFERQRTRLGGTEEVRSGFAARYAAYYHDAIETLIGLDRPADALHVLERSRARSLLALLAEREALFAAQLPAALARERAIADAEYDRVQARVARLDPGTQQEELRAQLARLGELREAREQIAARIRKAAPRLASVQYPEPMELGAVRGVLDPGTVLLAYSVGAERTVLFAVESSQAPGPGLATFSLPIGERALREKVETLRRGVQRAASGSLAGAALAELPELYDLLIRPAEAQIGRSRRLLLSPDGPLHSLPFASLVRRQAAAGKAAESYLVEWKPLHVAASATVYAELKRARRPPDPSALRVVAFGNPRYPALSRQQAEAIPSPDLRAAARSFSLAPLPATRDEVRGIARLFARRARTYLGEQATEERAKAIGRDVRYVHFACHGFLNERFPLNSALALTIPERPAEGQDNGLLQAWEIFDEVRLDADLVTLSACETALGKEMGGEGLLGLTRAFHYAGARSVLATLWGVSDTSTPLLMERFYAHLKAGVSRDEALQAAQLDFIRGRLRSSEDLAHPFRWAAFQLSGDWR